MKRFRCSNDQGNVYGHDPYIGTAAFLGWFLSEVGYEVLDQLEVGETTIDDDGDTWERVE